MRRKIFILMVSCIVMAIALPAFAGQSTISNLKISDQKAEQHAKKLKAMIEKKETQKKVEFKSSALKNGQEVNLPVKSATMEIGQFTTQDGSLVNVYSTLALTEVGFNNPTSREFSGITECIHMYWYETLPDDDGKVYINFDKGYVWWERDGDLSYVQDGYSYGRHEGELIGGGWSGDSAENKIGIPDWSSNKTDKFKLTWDKDVYTLKSNNDANGFGAYVRGDIYYQNDRIYDNFRVDCGF